MIEKLTYLPKLFLLILSVSWLSGLTACNSETAHASAPPQTKRDIALLTVQETMTPDYAEAMGTLHAAQSAQLSSQLLGMITRINVREGDKVRRDEVLITIDAARQKSAFENANAVFHAAQQAVTASDADFTLAESTMKRYQALYDKHSVSSQEYDEVKTKLAAAKAHRDGALSGQVQAEAEVSEAGTVLGFTRIRAPFDGLVVAKMADAGAVATPGVPLLVIEDPTHIRLEAVVDENKIGDVRLGQTVPVTIESIGSQTIIGKVVEIVPMADSSSRSFTVKIDLPPSPQIRSGLFGRVRFVRGERESILIPQIALIRRGQLDAVYVVGNDQVANLRYVSVGRMLEDRIEILSGLEIGERIAADPAGRELSGNRIEVK